MSFWRIRTGWEKRPLLGRWLSLSNGDPEDLAAKTAVAKTGAKNTAVKMEGFSRIQCTVDLLPQDILGFNRFIGHSGEMIFNKGPVFAHFVLCDEINLLTPKTQGSFFQVMEEQSVTIEGKLYKLTDPFFIIAR